MTAESAGLSRRERRQLKFYKGLAREEILAIDAAVPRSGSTRVQRNVGNAAFGVAGIAIDAKRSNAAAEKSLQRARGATTCAGRFPRVPCTLVLTPTRLVVTDLHHVTGRPSRVVAEYGLDEIESLSKSAGSLMHRTSVLTFRDSTSVKLGSPRGGGYYPRPFRRALTSALERHRQNRGDQ